MVCETVENGKLKRLVCTAPDLTEETGEQEMEGRKTTEIAEESRGRKSNTSVEAKRSCIQWEH